MQRRILSKINENVMKFGKIKKNFGNLYSSVSEIPVSSPKTKMNLFQSINNAMDIHMESDPKFDY